MTNAPPEVRILPMDSAKEFPDWSIEKLQHEFFLEDLPFRVRAKISSQIFSVQALTQQGAKMLAYRDIPTFSQYC